MAYCPKCGVEVENSIRECPLCRFPIPDISDPGMLEVATSNKYPEVHNIYGDYLEGVKNQIYFVVSVLLIGIILVLIVIDYVFKVDSILLSYFYIVAIALGAYTYFILGFHRWSLNITGLGITTVFLAYGVAIISGGQWFATYALPLCLLVYLNGLAFHYWFKHSSRKKRIGYLPTFVLMIVASLCIGVDGIVSWNLGGVVKLTWSLVAGMGLLCVAFLLQVIINRIPTSTKETIRRKFHL